MLDHESFIQGYKPALYMNTKKRSFEELESLMKYPFVKDGIDNFDGGDFYLFFQTTELKNDFVRKLKQVTTRSPEYHKLLGISLGYPPKAAKYFAERHKHEMEGNEEEFERMFSYNIGLLYAGVRCNNHVADIIENSLWLWDQYGLLEEKMKVRIETKYYEVDYKDISHLEKLRNIKLDQIKQILHT